MPAPTNLPFRSTALFLAAVGIFQFAKLFALCGQESGTIMARARVEEATGAWAAHRLVAERLALYLDGERGTHRPLPGTKGGVVFREEGKVVLREEQLPGGIRITVADLSR